MPLNSQMWRLQLRDFSAYQTFAVATWAEAAAILRHLDGFRHDEVSLEYAEGGAAPVSLLLGGGADGRVVVGLQLAETQPFRHLIDPAQGEALMTQSVGGQETPLPGRYYVPVDMALQAARYFFQQRAPDPALAWETSG